MMEISSLMRQVRDVMRSMRASIPGITTETTSTGVIDTNHINFNFNSSSSSNQKQYQNRNNSVAIREQREKTGRKL